MSVQQNILTLLANFGAIHSSNSMNAFAFARRKWMCDWVVCTLLINTQTFNCLVFVLRWWLSACASVYSYVPSITRYSAVKVIGLLFLFYTTTIFIEHWIAASSVVSVVVQDGVVEIAKRVPTTSRTIIQSHKGESLFVIVDCSECERKIPLSIDPLGVPPFLNNMLWRDRRDAHIATYRFLCKLCVQSGKPCVWKIVYASA
jgi:hypothetical protein